MRQIISSIAWIYPAKKKRLFLKGESISYHRYPVDNWHVDRPDEHNVLPYLQIMGKLKDAVDSVEQNQLRSCEKAVNQMVVMTLAFVVES